MSDKSILCIKWGTKYGPEYVNKLYRMCHRNMSTSFRFVCLTENTLGLDKNIDAKPLLYDHTKLTGWWQKLAIFQETVHDLDGDILFLDLDVVIINDITPFFTYDAKFPIIEDWLLSRPPSSRVFNSSVMRFKVGSQLHIWDEFQKNPDAVLKNFRGDQDWITYKAKGIKPWPEHWCVNYKWQECWNGPPDGARIVVFTGKPNPDEAIYKTIKSGGKTYPPAPWIANFWR